MEENTFCAECSSSSSRSGASTLLLQECSVELRALLSRSRGGGTFFVLLVTVVLSLLSSAELLKMVVEYVVVARSC